MPDETTPRRRRPFRRAARALGVALLALGVIVFVATRSFALRAIVSPRLSDALGAEVSIRHASLTGPFTLTLRDLKADARGVPTDAARVLTVERLDATIDWFDLLRGRFGVDEVRFEKPTLRLSQRIGTSALNLAALTPTQRGTGPLRLPYLVVRGGRVEFGEHDDAYTALATLEVDGVLDRASPDSPRYTIALVESVASAEARAPRNPSPITLEGWYDPLLVEGRLVLENVELSSWGPAAAPSDVRDLWARLRLAGEVERTEFVYTDADGVSVEFHFADVALELPIAADPQADIEMRPGPRDAPDRFMQISDARGVARLGEFGLRASVTGLIEDLPYRVEFQTTSLRRDTGFTIRFDTAEPFQVAERPQLLPFAPWVVRKTLASFSSPTALMEASVVASRADLAGDEQTPTSVDIRGVLTFSEGTASFADFPYRVNDIEALVRFDDEAVIIERMTGVGTTGATMAVQGIITPPTDGAMVDLRILFSDVPLDDAFDAAMPQSCDGLLGAIFSRDAERRLRDAGLLPDDFVVGGVGSLDIRVQRAFGEFSPYVWGAVFSLPEAGLLVDRFPYPARVRHARIEVASDAAEVRIAEVKGVAGGDGDLFARILLRDGEESVFVPTIALRTRGTPVSDLLLAALPGGLATRDASEDDESPTGARLNASEAIRALGLVGEVGAIARVLPRDDGPIGFDVFLEFEGVTSSPSGHESPLLKSVSGRIAVSESGLELSGVRGELDGGPFTLDGLVSLRDGGLASLDLRLGAESIDLSTRFESLVAPFSATGAETIRGAIDARGARGRLGVRAHLLASEGMEGIRAVVEPHAVQTLSFDAIGTRAEVRDLSGGVTIEIAQGEGVAATFTGVALEAAFGDDAPTRLSLNGRFFTGGAGLDERASLGVGAGVRWPSAIASALVRAATPERAGAVESAMNAWGLRLEARADAVVRSGGGSPVEIAEVVLAPARLAITKGDHQRDLRIESGTLRRDGEVVFVESLALRDEDLSFDVSGTARLDTPLSLNLTISGEAKGLDDRTLVFLPAPVGDTLRSVSLRADAMRVERAEVTIAGPDRDTLLRSTLRFDGLFFDVGGTSVHEVEGAAIIEIDTTDARPLDATLTFESARVQRVRLGRGVARVVALEGGGVFVVPSFEADAYSGRVFGVAKFVRERAVAGGQRPIEYQVEAQLSGVSFGALRQDLGVAPTGSSEDERGTVPLGQLDATIALAGVAGDLSTRVGRGAARVWGGAFLRLPLLSRLIELSNLQLPTGESLDFAHARFFLEGDTVIFEEMGVASDSVTLIGQGAMRWPSLALDVRVTSRAARRAPLLSDLLEAFRDELVTTRVTGTPAEPRYSVESLRTTRRFLDSIFGRRNDADTRVRPPARQVRQIDRSPER